MSPGEERLALHTNLSPGLGMSDHAYEDVLEDDPEREPSAELIRRLRQLEGFVSPQRMGEIWIFPPLDEPEGTREFVLFTRMSGPDERAVFTARHRPGENGGNGAGGPTGEGTSENGKDPRGAAGEGSPDQPDQTVVEHGRAPADRLSGLVEDLLRRLGEERAPIHVSIEGSRRRWEGLVTGLAGGDASGRTGEGAEPEAA